MRKTFPPGLDCEHALLFPSDPVTNLPGRDEARQRFCGMQDPRFQGEHFPAPESSLGSKQEPGREAGIRTALFAVSP